MTVDREDLFDVDALRIDPADSSIACGATGSRKAKWQRKFVRVPWMWVERLKGTKRAATYKLALFLIYEHWRNGGRAIQLTNGLAGDAGVDAKTKWRALADLEQLQLVEIERRGRRSPVIKPLHVKNGNQ